MQTSYSSSRILLPVRPWFIACTLLVALLLRAKVDAATLKELVRLFA